MVVGAGSVVARELPSRRTIRRGCCASCERPLGGLDASVLVVTHSRPSVAASAGATDPYTIELIK
ncbi:hypothetical protein [Nocardia sp. NPDC004604]|uniref:hypothetical protein n=1 Tax=Nocardia sp. NPDC004604 TaxID=3157013 RepID=UPI0033B75832